jgi:hypothetical protein
MLAVGFGHISGRGNHVVLLEAKLNLVNSILLEEFGIVVKTQRAF